MSCSPEEIERLERALDAVGQRGGTADGAVDPGTLWDAVEGRLPPEDLARLAERAVAEPGLRREWRMALLLSRERRIPSRTRRRNLAWILSLAAAAVVVLGLALPLVLHRSGPPGRGYRGLSGSSIERAAGDVTPMPRGDFLLRWRCGIEGARFDVVVSDAGLHVLASAAGLEEPFYRVPAEVLKGLPAGSAVLWQVRAVLPDGSSVVSPTFVEHLR